MAFLAPIGIALGASASSAALVGTIATVAAVGTIGGTVTSILGARQQGKATKRQEEIAGQQLSFQKEQKKKQEALVTQTQQAEATATEAAKKRRRVIGGRQTQTILTGPQGALTPAQTFGKTLLGG